MSLQSVQILTVAIMRWVSAGRVSHSAVCSGRGECWRKPSVSEQDRAPEPELPQGTADYRLGQLCSFGTSRCH